MEIDVNARTCTAEPGVTFEQLVAATQKHGLVPLVVPELKTITVGGAVSGCSIESMSFRIGGFHDTCLEYEIVTTDGRVLQATADNEHALVFQMMHGSYGTLGILTKLKFRLVPCKPYVHVTYHSYPTLDEYRRAIERYASDARVDFLDGIIHSPTKYVLSIGRFVDEAPYTHRYDWVKVYYKTTATRQEDYLTTTQYFFRYDRGVTNPTPKSAVARFLFGKWMTSARLLRLAEKFHHLLPGDRPNVTVDLFLPISRADEFLRWHQNTIGHYPLWVVPYRRIRDYEWLSPSFYEGIEDGLFLDIAIYGMKRPAGRNIYQEIEEALLRFNGVKTLISHNYYDESTFWQIYNRQNYAAAKRLTDPKGLLRDLYAKTCDSKGATPRGTAQPDASRTPAAPRREVLQHDSVGASNTNATRV